MWLGPAPMVRATPLPSVTITPYMCIKLPYGAPQVCGHGVRRLKSNVTRFIRQGRDQPGAGNSWGLGGKTAGSHWGPVSNPGPSVSSSEIFISIFECINNAGAQAQCILSPALKRFSVKVFLEEAANAYTRLSCD